MNLDRSPSIPPNPRRAPASHPGLSPRASVGQGASDALRRFNAALQAKSSRPRDTKAEPNLLRALASPLEVPFSDALPVSLGFVSRPALTLAGSQEARRGPSGALCMLLFGKQPSSFGSPASHRLASFTPPSWMLPEGGRTSSAGSRADGLSQHFEFLGKRPDLLLSRLSLYRHGQGRWSVQLKPSMAEHAEPLRRFLCGLRSRLCRNADVQVGLAESETSSAE